MKWSNTAGWKWLILQNSNSSGIATLGNKKKNPSYQLMITPNPCESYLYLSASYHYAINIADPSSMQDVCYMNFVIDHACPWSLWLSGRALECGIWRSEVWFLMGTRNFFFVPYSWNDRKHLSLIFLQFHYILPGFVSCHFVSQNRISLSALQFSRHWF